MTRSEILQVAKPILFNTEMVRAILDGRKTVTRRVIKPQHLRVLDSPYHKEHPEVPDKVLIEKLCKPPYEPGCYLYVRETWGIGNLFYDDEDIPNLCVCYKASEDRIDETCTTFKITDEQYEKYDNRMTANMQDWFPSIHMPKEAARIFLRVTGVRVERLSDMDYMDAIYEGIEPQLGEDGYPVYNPMIDFIDLWDSTIPPKDHDKYGWAANPWVFVIEFERVEVEQ